MTWIKTVPYKAARGKLRTLYDRIKGPQDNVDNIMLAHSLRPHTMEGHMALYKYVLHHPGNSLPNWFLETVGVYVSLINACEYCVEHHFAGLRRLLDDDDKAQSIRTALESNGRPNVLEAKYNEGLHYAGKLTRTPGDLGSDDIDSLRNAGFNDGEILEINQVSAYFSYANRTVLGLGINTEGDIIGLSPNDTNDPENWSHL